MLTEICKPKMHNIFVQSAPQKGTAINLDICFGKQVHVRDSRKKYVMKIFHLIKKRHGSENAVSDVTFSVNNYA